MNIAPAQILRKSLWDRHVRATSCTPNQLVRLAAVKEEEIIAIGLLTQSDVDRLGPAFRRIYPVDETRLFDDLLRAIDDRTHAGKSSPTSGRR